MSQVTARLHDRFVHLAYWQVNDVKDVMMENIEKVLERGEKIEVRHRFWQQPGKAVQRFMWWSPPEYLAVAAVSIRPKHISRYFS